MVASSRPPSPHSITQRSVRLRAKYKNARAVVSSNSLKRSACPISPSWESSSAVREAKAASGMGCPSIVMVSRRPVTAGEAYRPVRQPAAVRMLWIIRAVEPLPLVPAM